MVEKTMEAVYSMLVKIITQGTVQDKEGDARIEKIFHCRIGAELSDQAIKEMLGGN